MSSWHPQRGHVRSLEGHGLRDLPHLKRGRRASSGCDTCVVTSTSEGGSVMIKSAPQLPGLVWDEAKQRYFRLPPTHSHLYRSSATAAAPSTSDCADEQALQDPYDFQRNCRSSSLASSMRLVCEHPHSSRFSRLLPMMRECVGSFGRAASPAGSCDWRLVSRQSVQGCKHAAYFSRSVVLFSDQNVSLLPLPSGVLPHAAAPINQILQLPSNPFSSSAINVTAAFHSSERYSWLNYGTSIHVAAAAQNGSSASAAAVTIMNCQFSSSGMIPHSVQSSFLIGARHPCAWLGRGSSCPTLDWDNPICYVSGGKGGQYVAALPLDQSMPSRTALEWRMPNSMAVSCMSLWRGCGSTHERLIFCGGSSCEAVSIDPRSNRTASHPNVRHVTQCGWPGGCQMVCGHVGGSICVWDMRFTKNAISTTAPQKEVYSLWSLSVSSNAALALFTKHDTATFLDLGSFRVKKFETQISAGGEGSFEAVSRIASQGEGCAVFNDALLVWDARQAWAWHSS